MDPFVAAMAKAAEHEPVSQQKEECDILHLWPFMVYCTKKSSHGYLSELISVPSKKGITSH